MGGGAVEDDLAGTAVAGDSVGLKASGIGHVAAKDSFIGQQPDAVNQIAVDGHAAFVIEVGGCDPGAVDLGFEQVNQHVWLVRCLFTCFYLRREWEEQLERQAIDIGPAAVNSEVK